MSNADARVERHARTFAGRQAVRDPQVEALMKQGYLAQQIASILQRPAIDVRLAMALARKGTP